MTKQAEIDAARKELANLKLQRAAAELRSPDRRRRRGNPSRPGDILERGTPALEDCSARRLSI